MKAEYQLKAVHQAFFPEFLVYFEIEGKESGVFKISVKDLSERIPFETFLSKADVERVLYWKSIFDHHPSNPGGGKKI